LRRWCGWVATVGEIADVMRKRFGEYHPAQ
jgi:hypothetical protein